MGIVLILIARILITLIAPLNFVAVVIKYSKHNGFLKTIDSYYYSEARSLDINANRSFRTLWRLIFKGKKSKHDFGIKKETISVVLGYNFIDKTLTLFGYVFYYILYGIDFKTWKKGGHCIDAVNQFEKRNKNN